MDLDFLQNCELTWDHHDICVLLHHPTLQCIKYVAGICFHREMIIGMFATKCNIILKPDKQPKATGKLLGHPRESKAGSCWRLTVPGASKIRETLSCRQKVP